MIEILKDLNLHGSWADAEHWRALEKHAPALEDQVIRQRLHHLHLAQHAFLAIVRDETLDIRKIEDFPDTLSLKAYAMSYHRGIASWLDTATLGDLFVTRRIPWARDPALEVRVTDILTQAAMHSHYHRGQNATRLRELGGEPPLIDYLLWVWKGRPAPAWTDDKPTG